MSPTAVCSKISWSGTRSSICTEKSAVRSGGVRMGGGFSSAARTRAIDTGGTSADGVDPSTGPS